MKYKLFSLLALLLLTSFSGLPTRNNRKPAMVTIVEKPALKAESLYDELKSKSFVLPSFDCFTYAIEGFLKYKEQGVFQKDILTLVDFSQSGNTKRLWVIDLSTSEILLHTLVAHGRNTGEEFAKYFSNRPESFQSSLGFYATAEVYNGKHGVSLKLDGLQQGLNDKARERAVVIHGADYVSEKFIQNNKRLGRSQGCPAVPVEYSEKLIGLIKGNTCLFIYHPSQKNKFI
jgi:hypothetical protein